MLRFLAVLIGLAFIGFGAAGYMPQYNETGLLFGYFEVDSMHNMIHIVTGVLALLCGMSSRLAKLFFVLFGLIYLTVAVLGFWRQGDLMVVHANGADNLLHLGVGVVLLLLGISG